MQCSVYNDLLVCCLSMLWVTREPYNSYFVITYTSLQTKCLPTIIQLQQGCIPEKTGHSKKRCIVDSSSPQPLMQRVKQSIKVRFFCFLSAFRFPLLINPLFGSRLKSFVFLFLLIQLFFLPITMYVKLNIVFGLKSLL